MPRVGTDGSLPVFPGMSGRILERCVQLLRGRGRDARRGFLLRMLPKQAVCAEIGVWKGQFSRGILEVTRPRQLHLIDPWTFQPEFPTRIYGGGDARSQQDMEAIFERVVDELGSQAPVHVHRKTSRQAAPGFPDACFDWIYLDANHSYEYVREDLALFFPKVKPGGLIAGDDYRKEVKRAVDELVATGRVRLVTAKKRQFVLRKPG